MKLLITGFDPFGGEALNPSWEAVKVLPDRIGTVELVKLELPTAFDRSARALTEAITLHRPQAVLSVGQAGGRAAVTVERVAVNLADAAIPDNDGFQPLDLPLVPGGPAAYFSTLPVKAMAEGIRAAGIPCQLSYSAGTYVCNSVLYRALHLAETACPGLLAGFIHVPFTPLQAAQKPAGTPSMAPGDMVRALEEAVYVIGSLSL